MLHMDSFFFFLSPSFFLIIFLLVFLQVASAEDDIQYTNCSPFDCGKLGNISYPFWTDNLGRPAYCGYVDERYKLKCVTDQFPVITISSQEFLLVGLNQSRSLMTIKRRPLDQSGKYINCPKAIPMDMVFSYSNTAVNMTLSYGCRSRASANHNFTCKLADGREDFALFFEENNGEECDTRKVEIPVGKEALNELILGKATLNETLVQSFDMRYVAYDGYCKQCNQSGGRCGTNANSSQVFTCYCSDRPYPFTCELHGKKDPNLKLKLAIGFGGGIGGMLITCFLFYLLWRRRRGKVSNKSSYASGKSYSDRSSMLDTEKGDSFGGVHSFAARVHVFTYNELEEATNNFASDRELGDGGFGTVYYGKLRDGRAVAVKRLYENNYRRVEQFMNEVEILTRLRHKNLVQLYGCTSRHSRELLLVYEYVPKGTVADHLHGQHAKPCALPLCIRLQIAIETADALRYLHASDTIHRDVKTNNILLDNNYTVKVADFGLSRLFPTDVTHVSTAPQGTPGYVDPEYHQCYQLTDKSDVFSFGVVLIELISSKPAVDITRHRHEINLSNMAINKIQNRALHELVDPSLGFQSDSKARKLITGVAEVAFQCLQNEKDLRPTMAEVLEALLGIQNEDYNKSKPEVMDISADEVVLLKSGPLPNSPDSVMLKWVSSGSTIPSTGN